MNKFVRILLVLAVLATTTVSLVSAQDAAVDRTDWPAVFSFGRFAGDDAASALNPSVLTSKHNWVSPYSLT
jgi:hypothetical protein